MPHGKTGASFIDPDRGHDAVLPRGCDNNDITNARTLGCCVGVIFAHGRTNGEST
jgi:hypothetical protein